MRIAPILSAVALGAACLLVPASAGTAMAPAPSPTYDVLGDSYASGAGVLPYDAATCQRSLQAPARLVDGRMRIQLDDFVACGGARAQDIAGQAEAALDGHTDLVTVSVGGNDIRWIEAVIVCAVAELPTCQDAVGASRDLVQNVLPGLLDTAYTQIRAAAPNAHVVVTGYARLFTPEYGDWAPIPGQSRVTPEEQQLMNDGADLLNRVIAGVAAEHGFQFVDVTRRFDGHGVNSDDPWILDFGTDAPLHPNQAGYQKYAAAITGALRPRDLR